MCISLHGKVLVAGGCRSGFCEKTLEATPPVRQSLFQLASKQTCCWPKPSALSFVGSTSVIRNLRKSKKCCTGVVREEWEHMSQTALQTPRSENKEGEVMLQAPQQRFLCSPWRRPWWFRLSYCAACGGPCAGAGGDALREAEAHGEPTQEQAPRRGGGPWRGPCRSRFSGRVCGLRKTHAGGISSWRTALHGKDQCRRRFVQDSILWEGLHAGAVEECEEEGAADTKLSGMNWPQSLFPIPLC